MKKLFMIGLGGNLKNTNVEIHDMRFVLANHLEETFQTVKENWYGDDLHLDSYTIIEEIDGYTLDLEESSKERLYMIVYGGYKKDHIDELHTYDFVLATTAKEAKKLGKDKMDAFPPMDHVDKVVDVFDQLGESFGFHQSNGLFKNNKTVHKFLKL